MKAASSISSRDTASERAASEFDDLAVILDPFDSRKLNLFFSCASILNQEGKLSYINCTFDTKLRAVACVVAKVKTFLSL